MISAGFKKSGEPSLFSLELNLTSAMPNISFFLFDFTGAFTGAFTSAFGGAFGGAFGSAFTLRAPGPKKSS